MKIKQILILLTGLISPVVATATEAQLTLKDREKVICEAISDFKNDNSFTWGALYPVEKDKKSAFTKMYIYGRVTGRIQFSVASMTPEEKQTFVEKLYQSHDCDKVIFNISKKPYKQQ